jgi:integrase
VTGLTGTAVTEVIHPVRAEGQRAIDAHRAHGQRAPDNGMRAGDGARHGHAVEMAREGVPLIVIQRQLGHSNLGITSVYLQGTDNAEIIDTVHARRAPMILVSPSLRL